MSAPSVTKRELDELRMRLCHLERQLALEVPHEAPIARDRDLHALICVVDGNRIGFALESVSEIAPIATTTPLPEAPPWVIGILDLRGLPVPVLDVAARIDRRARTPEISDQIVLCALEGRAVGLVVSAVVGVDTFAPEAIASTPGDVSFAQYVRAALIDAAGPILLLSVPQLVLSSDIEPVLPSGEPEGDVAP